MMSRQHYILLAGCLRAAFLRVKSEATAENFNESWIAGGEAALMWLLRDLERKLKEDNPAFSKVRFQQACFGRTYE